MRVSLPHHRRHNWRILYRNHRTACKLVCLAVLIGLIIAGVLHALHAEARIADAELATSMVTAEHMSLRNWGRFTVTDWKEGTVEGRLK